MLRFTEVLTEHAVSQGTLTLTFDERQKTRFRARLDQGGEISVLVPRGSVLRNGTLLRGDDGVVIQVCAAREPLSVVSAPDALTLTRAAYHLGNRHVPVQIERARLLYPHDHVLDRMVTELGLSVTVVDEAFEPEAGAYSQGGAHAGAAHTHDHHHT